MNEYTIDTIFGNFRESKYEYTHRSSRIVGKDNPSWDQIRLYDLPANEYLANVLFNECGAIKDVGDLSIEKKINESGFVRFEISFTCNHSSAWAPPDEEYTVTKKFCESIYYFKLLLHLGRNFDIEQYSNFRFPA